MPQGKGGYLLLDEPTASPDLAHQHAVLAIQQHLIMNTMSDTVTDSLSNRWRRLREEEPELRIRDAAERLKTSEAELLATSVGDGVTLLDADWGEILKALPDLGEVMALTRNAHAVHERKGTYQNVTVDGMMGLVLDPEIDFCVFLAQWRFGFAVVEDVRGVPRYSLHFFDRHGTAVHKLYLQADADVAAFHRIRTEFAALHQLSTVSVEPNDPPTEELPDEEIDYDGLYAEWRLLRDTHHFFGLLRCFNVARLQALQSAPSDLAVRVGVNALHRVLVDASAASLPIMVFVGSPGVIQIHTGPVERIVETGDWVNVLDPRFNLHVRQSGIASAWIVRKPTDDGVVTALELFDADGGVVAMLFGKRKPGIPESTAWRSLVESLEVQTPFI